MLHCNMNQMLLVLSYMTSTIILPIMTQDELETEVNEVDNFECYFCVNSRKKKDMADGVDQNTDCMNHLKFGSRPEMRRQCTGKEKFCVSTVTNLNGFFIMVERDCAEDCSEGCEEHGYGLFYTQCTRCCKNTLCNEYDGKDYYKPNSQISSSSSIVFILFICYLLYEQ